jgi:tRNA (cytidine32/uridine32-2'-O)-methyltransferase
MAPVSERLRFVLVRPSHPANIGAAARAIRTMGFARLVLVAPHAYPHADVTALAAGASDVLERIVVVPDLMAAIGDCRLVLGATARARGVRLPESSPREAAAQALAAALEGEVAVVFGNERTGLENEEMNLCHGAIHIPSDPSFSSLNLAQAVQVLAYELRLGVLGEAPASAPARSAPPDERDEPPADAQAMEGFFQHLAQTLDDIEFHKGRSPVTIMQRLRRLFLRAEPDTRELRVLRGILADAQRMARLARER